MSRKDPFIGSLVFDAPAGVVIEEKGWRREALQKVSDPVLKGISFSCLPFPPRLSKKSPAAGARRIIP
jgi:hypothetical protein